MMLLLICAELCVKMIKKMVDPLTPSRHKTLEIAEMQLQPTCSIKGIIVSTLAEADFFFAGGHQNITFGCPVIPWCVYACGMSYTHTSDTAAVPGTFNVV